MSIRHLILLGLFSTKMVTSQTPPAAPRVEHREVRHGATVIDDYFWLREKSNPKVTQYLEAENAYTAAMTKDLQPFSDALYQEMLGRIKQTDLSVPTPHRGYLYYSRTEEGKQYPIQCRRKGTMEAPEEVLLDLNELGKDKKFVGLGAFVVSDDQNLLAYTIDYTGFRQYALRVKDLRTGETLPDTTERVTSLAWAADNKTLFLVTEDAVTKRSDKLWRHVLGAREVRRALQREGRTLRYRHRQDPRPEVPVPAERGQGHLRSALPARRPAGGQVRGLSAARKEPPLLRGPSRRAVLHPHQQGRPQFRHDDRAGGRSRPPRTGRSFVPHRDDVRIQDIDLFRISRCRWRSRRRWTTCASTISRPARGRKSPFPEPVYSVFPGGTPDYESAHLSLQLPEPRDALERFRLRHAHRQIHAAKAAGSAGRLRPEAVRQRAPVGHRPRRRQGADFDRLQEGLRARRQGAAVPLRLRLLRHRHAAHVLQQPRQPARPRHGLRHRAHPRRRRDGRTVARRRHAHEEEEHLLRLHRLRRIPDPAEVDLRRTAW